MKVRSEVIAVPLAVLLVAAAFVVPHLNLGIVTPMIHTDVFPVRLFAQTAPVFGWWNAHVGWGTPAAILIGVAAVAWGPSLAQRLGWRALTLTTWATSCAWAFSLAMVDGWKRGFAGRLTAKHEYLQQVPSVTDIPTALRDFVRRIPDFQPDSWITHVSGHPPGALLTFVWLDRIGLSGGAWAAVLCLLAGSSAAAAIIVTLRALCDEDTARLAAPFVAVAPTAIWIAVSADGYFAGVAAWGLAMLALAVSRNARCPVVVAAGAGLLLGWAIFLNYGLALMAILALAVLICARSRRDAGIALAAAVPAALIVVGAFAWAGFWWFDGYTAVQQRYWQGIADARPFQYWGWANLASVVCAAGLGSVAGVSKVFNRDGDPATVRHSSTGACRTARDPLRRSVDVEQGRDRTDLAAVHDLADRRTRPAAAGVTPLVACVNVVGALLLNHLILTNW